VQFYTFLNINATTRIIFEPFSTYTADMVCFRSGIQMRRFLSLNPALQTNFTQCQRIVRTNDRGPDTHFVQYNNKNKHKQN